MKVIMNRDYKANYRHSPYLSESVINDLQCSYCNFYVMRPHVQPRTSKSGLGKFNVMRAQMVKHLHECHRDLLLK